MLWPQNCDILQVVVCGSVRHLESRSLEGAEQPRKESNDNHEGERRFSYNSCLEHQRISLEAPQSPFVSIVDFQFVAFANSEFLLNGKPALTRSAAV